MTRSPTATSNHRVAHTAGGDHRRSQRQPRMRTAQPQIRPPRPPTRRRHHSRPPTPQPRTPRPATGARPRHRPSRTTTAQLAACRWATHPIRSRRPPVLVRTVGCMDTNQHQAAIEITDRPRARCRTRVRDGPYSSCVQGGRHGDRSRLLHLGVVVGTAHDGSRRPLPTPEDDVFYVLQGTMAVLVGDRWIDAPSGAFVLVPGGVTHDFENRSDAPAGVLNVLVPGRLRADTCRASWSGSPTVYGDRPWVRW